MSHNTPYCLNPEAHFDDSQLRSRGIKATSDYSSSSIISHQPHIVHRSLQQISAATLTTIIMDNTPVDQQANHFRLSLEHNLEIVLETLPNCDFNAIHERVQGALEAKEIAPKLQPRLTYICKRLSRWTESEAPLSSDYDVKGLLRFTRWLMWSYGDPNHWNDYCKRQLRHLSRYEIDGDKRQCPRHWPQRSPRNT